MKDHSYTHVLIVFLSLLSVSIEAAQGNPVIDEEYSRQSFERADQNGDGKIDSEEYTRDAIKSFAWVDSDHDAQIEEDDFPAYEKSFQQLDVNSDGKVPLKEFMQLQVKKFEIVDRDNSGYLSLEEVIEFDSQFKLPAQGDNNGQ